MRRVCHSLHGPVRFARYTARHVFVYDPDSPHAAAVLGEYEHDPLTQKMVSAVKFLLFPQ